MDMWTYTAWIYRHQHIDDTMAAKSRKAIRFGMCVIMTVMGMNLLGIHFFSLCLKLDTKEVVTEKKNGYTYLDVYWDNLGYNSYTVAYRTNNPFIMKKVNVLSDDQVKALKNLKKQNGTASTASDEITQNSKSMTEGSPDQTQEPETTDSKEKTDANNTNCDEFVLEKRYVNGGYDTEIIDFYLINPNTLEVTDEHKTTW